MSISCTALRSAILTSFFFPLGRCSANRAKFCMDRKTLLCLQNASQHVPVYLQQFLSYSNHNRKKNRHFYVPRPSFFVCPGDTPDNHAKCCINEKTIQCLPNPSQHLPIYLQQFPSYSNRKCKKSPFSRTAAHIFVSPGDAPGAITLNVVWIERQFAAYKLSRCMCPSNYNRFWDRARYWSKIVIFSYPLAFDAPVRGVPVGIAPPRLV